MQSSYSRLTVRVGSVYPARQRLTPLAWMAVVLSVPLPLPDLTHSSSARGQEAPAPQDTTHPGKIKNMKDKKHRSRDKSIVVLTTRMTVESASRSTQIQAPSDTGGSSVPPGKCQRHYPWKVQAAQVQARAPYSSGFQRSGGVTTMPTPGTVTT